VQIKRKVVIKTNAYDEIKKTAECKVTVKQFYDINVNTEITDPSIVSLARWVGNSSCPGDLPIRAFLANRNRPFGKHAEPTKTVPLDPFFQ